MRYADDFVVMVAGTRQHAEAIREQIMPRSSPPSGCACRRRRPTIAHIDEGFDFLGFRIQRQTKRGSNQRYVYTWPAKKVADLDQGQGQDDHQTRHEQPAEGPAAPAQPGAARLDQLLPARGGQADIQLPPGHTPGDASSDGCDASTTAPTGSRSAAATSPTDGGPRTTGRRCSTPEPCR